MKENQVQDSKQTCEIYEKDDRGLLKKLSEARSRRVIKNDQGAKSEARTSVQFTASLKAFRFNRCHLTSKLLNLKSFFKKGEKNLLMRNTLL